MRRLVGSGGGGLPCMGLGGRGNGGGGKAGGGDQAECGDAHGRSSNGSAASLAMVSIPGQALNWRGPRVIGTSPLQIDEDAAMLRRLYDRILRLAASPRAPLWLAVIAFSESSFFPVPPDALLIPMALARPNRAFRYALICTAASVVGGIVGWLIGYALFDVLARPVLHFYHYEDAFDAFQQRFREYGRYIILI
jgi:hypothetical protein